MKTTLVVDYQRERHAARRRKADEGQGGSGARDVSLVLLGTGLVLAAVYLAAEDPWAKRAGPARDPGAVAAMKEGRPPGVAPVATVGARSGGRAGVRR